MTSISSTYNNGTNSNSSTNNNNSVSDNMEQFLTLLTTQLQNQSPLDPMNPTEFTGQLAQYSSLEQQIKTNDYLASVISSVQGASAISYLNQDVRLDGNEAPIQDGKASWSYTLQDEAAEVTITIKDADGNTLYTADGSKTKGPHDFTLDLEEAGIDAGDLDSLFITISATDSSGKSLSGNVYANAHVDGVDTSGDSPVFSAGGVSFSLDDIVYVS